MLRTCDRWTLHALAVCCALVCCGQEGCKTVDKSLIPSNHRDWRPDHAVLPTAEFHGDQITVRNVRNCRYLDRDSYVVDYYDLTLNTNSIRAVDFMVAPFGPVPALAHTMLSFEFDDAAGNPRRLVMSVEVRKERGEEFDPAKGAANQYEIMYVAADERDVIGARVQYFDEDIYLYRTRATPALARAVFIDMAERMNELSEEPEFYNLVTNNCTTNLVDHLNRIKPNRVVYDWRVLLPGMSDRKAYEEGLLATDAPFEQAKAAAHVNPRVAAAIKSDDFSSAIRR